MDHLEAFLMQTEESQVRFTPGYRCAAMGRHFRAQLFKFLQITSGGKKENGCIPVISPGLQIGFGGFQVWLFDEPADFKGAFAAVNGLTTENIAISGLRRFGLHTQGDHGAAAGRSYRLLDGLGQFIRLSDHVIGGQQKNERIASIGAQIIRGDGCGGCRVAAHGFQNDGSGTDLRFAQLFRH